MALKCPVAAYFYPLTTTCVERNARARACGFLPIDETELVQKAKPLFPGHDQPKVYSYDGNVTRWDDADPKTMQAQMRLAREHGIGTFIFLTYMGMSGGRWIHELRQPLDDAFLPTSHDHDMRFGLLCSFRRPRVMLPCPMGVNEPDRHYDLSLATARGVIDCCAKRYWCHPQYLRIRQRPFLALWADEIPTLDQPLAQFSAMVTEMRDYAEHKWRIQPYFVGIVRNTYEVAPLLRCPFDALSGYAFLPDFGSTHPMLQDYKALLAKREAEWISIAASSPIPFIPPAVVGWDASPTGQQPTSLSAITGVYPYSPIVTDNSPDAFGAMIEKVSEHLRSTVPPDDQMLIVCAWNEIRQANALLPLLSTKNPFGHLFQLKRSLAACGFN